MPWCRFVKNFDWSPRYGVEIAYRAGNIYLVTTACSRAALMAGAALLTRNPRLGDDDGWSS